MNRHAVVLMLAALAACAGEPVTAQSYPNKSIRMIIPAPPGGAVDTVGRAVAQKLAVALGQPVVADNRPGAGTVIAAELTAKAPPDGHTFLMVTNSHAITASVQKNLPYDPVHDFSPVALLSVSPYLLVVHPAVPAKSVRELVALARQRPGQLHFASAGSSSATHLAGELFKSLARINLVHVPYKGGSPAAADLVGGHVEMMFNNLISVIGLVKAGRLRALAVTSARRLPVVPDLPTVAEAGVPGYEDASWVGALLPAGTPLPIVDILNRELVKAIQAPEVRDRLVSEGVEVVGSTAAAFAQYLTKDIERWRKLAPSLAIQ